MRRKIENETRKLKSSSNERTSHLSSKYSNWNSDKRFDPKSPKRRNLISANEVNDSFDTCIFPSESRDEFGRVSCGMQTDPAPCYLESLVIENQSLASQVKELKLETESLKSLVKDLVRCKKLAKFQVNQEIIEMLENENKIIKRYLEPN